jgi:hypothetical protein
VTRQYFKDVNEHVDEDMKNAVEISLPFDNNLQAPVIITEARMKAIKASSVYIEKGNDLVYWADQYAINASLTLVNNSPSRVKGVSITLSCDKAGPLGYPTVHLVMEPGATFQIAQKELTGLGDPSSFSVRVGEVLFEDGDIWPKELPAGTLIINPPPPPPPPLPRRREGLQR